MGILGIFGSRKSLLESGIMNGAADRHSHILYGVDDGIMTAEEALAVLAFEESAGVSDVWCTPHIMEDVPNSSDMLKARFDELCSMYKGPIRLHLAAEYMMDTLFEKRLAARDLLMMEDEMVLMETSAVAPPFNMNGLLSETMAAGYRPLFAHPERCRFLEVKDCEEMVAKGVRLQLNIASLTGYYGNAARVKAEALLKKGLYFAFGSDCHRVNAIMEQYSRPELSKETVKLLNHYF